MFIQLLSQQGSAALLGQFGALLFLMLANMIGFYRRYFMDDVIVAQPRQDGVPW